MIELSVVVATYNRRDTLSVTLARLANQTLAAARYEVIVVDDGSPDDTQEMVRGLMEEVPYQLKYLRHANRGPGFTENRGIREAAGRLVLLMADDIHAESEMLSNHVRFHQQHPEENVASLAKVLQSPELRRTTFLVNWDPFRYRELPARQVELPYWKFWACNICVKREFLLQNGLFRELKGASHEDVELGYRLHLKGLKIVYHPEAVAYHHHEETLDSAAQRAFERGLNWRFIEENVPDPQIHVKYHILNWHTLGYHLQTFRRVSESDLPPEDRNLPWLLFRQVVRWVAFNRATVPYFWMPLLRRAEHHRLLAALVNPYMYRGAVFYHFIRGAAKSRALPEAQAASAQA